MLTVHKLHCRCGKCRWLLTTARGKVIKFRGYRRDDRASAVSDGRNYRITTEATKPQ